MFSFSIFHEDNFNQEESANDSLNSSAPLDVNRATRSTNVNATSYSMNETIQDHRSSSSHFQQSIEDSEACQSQKYNCNEDYSEESDSDSYSNEMFNYDSQSRSKRYKTESFHFSDTATSFENLDVIKCRELIDKVANSCYSAFLKRIDEIKCLSKGRCCARVHCTEHKQKFLDRINNLYNQQIEFDKFVSSVKAQFNIINIQNQNFEKAIDNLRRESVTFQQFFPAYGFRQKILDAVEEKQVVIINSSQIYSLNVALPLILSNIYREFSLIVCEPNEILSHVLLEKINIATSCYGIQLQDTQTFVLSEDQLLKRCLYTTDFAANKSCIIVNVSLKRSVKADIIFSLLRDLLITQKHSKLILLLSPQDDEIKFADYFSSKVAVSVLKFPDLSLSVKTIWKSAVSYPQDDFKDDLVKTIFSVHAVYHREQGDIVAFLPSLEDVQCINEKIEVENSYYHYNLKVICAGDDLDYILKSVITLSSSAERKIFLLINGYEGLPVPSARFIIDCGIQKELYFDSQTDTNIVIPTFISQSRAKMRKYLAGEHHTGMCFRLFNKSNYLKNMFQKEPAEVFCINPVQSIVMSLQYCPQKKKPIQFVEPLPEDLLQSTLNTLKSYGAIDKDLSLTRLGEDIVKFPLPLKYSRFILHGIQSGFAFEAIILVAFFSVKSRLFVEAVDDEHQRLIEMTKLHFIQSDSDTLTYLSIYKLWKNSGFKKAWCREHFINFDTLKSIRCKINEIVHLVPECLGHEILQQFSEGSDQNYLIQMLFECFHYNCCSYTGHPRLGYRILSSGKYASIHSSSFLFQKNNCPDFVIYEDSVSSDPVYIKHLTSIPFDTIAEFSQQNKLKFDSSALFDYKLETRVIDSVGDKVINRFLPKSDKKKIEEVEDRLKKKVNAHVVIIEPVLEKGCVNIFALPDDIDKCFVSLKDILSDYIQTMTNEEECRRIEYTHGQNKVTFETKWIKGAETTSARHVLIPSNFALQNSASCAVESVTESSDSSSINYTLKVSWPRLVCTGEGYIKFKNQNDFQRARLLSFKNVKVDDYEVFVQVNNSAKYQMLVSQIPSVVTKTDIENTFSSLLPGCKFEVELCYTAPFETNDSDLELMKRQLEENCIHFSNITSFDVKMAKPNPSSKYMTAYINVFEERCLNKEAQNLSETKVNNMKLSCEPLYFSELKCSAEIYNVLKYCIKDELDMFLEKNEIQHKRYSLRVILGKDFATIKLSSDDIEVMKLVQMRVNQIINGIRLDSTNLKEINKLFCHGGHVFLKALAEAEKVHIITNYEAKIIRLFGPQENCNSVRQNILNFIQDTENEVGKNIILCDEKQNRFVLKAIIMQYGANLEKFIVACGLRSAALNLKTSCLSIYGNKESVEKAEECIRELSGIEGSIDSLGDSASAEICPVCFMPAESLSFRLQHCGHLYCSGCIKGLIDQAQFPIQCCAENCSKPITLGDIKYIINDDVVEIHELADKSLKAYLDRNRDKIYYCPAADCSMFMYRNEISENKWNCPLCKNYICISCNVVYHEGFSCDMYRGSKEDPDYSFKVWQKSTVECKQCPRCKTAIQKTFGCNHMTCRSCGAHFCWMCVTEFPNADAVYTHMGTCRAR